MIFTQIRTPLFLKDYELPSLDDIDSDIQIEEAERYLDYEVPYIPMSLYMEFRKNGNRSHYENPYFEKRKALSALVLGEYLERKGRFLGKAIDTLYSILQETTWTFSAHNTFVRDTQPMMLPDTKHPIIDLFSAETGATVTIASRLLSELLGNDREYDNLFASIEDAIRSRIVLPYITDHFWWMGDGTEEINNWAPWCTENVLLCFFLSRTDRRERDKAFRQALYTLECFAKDYGEDGCCSEGAEYYRHAALCMLDAMEILDSVSKGALSSCFMDGKIRNMLSYAAKVNVQGDFFINFADCSARPGHAGCREFRAGMLTGNRDLMDFAKNQMDGSDRRERLYLDEISFFHRILAASMEHRIESHKAGLYRTEDAFFPSIELLVQRKGPYVFAIKGGDNNDSHNHNDVGSMTLYKDGRPLLIDIGVEVYTAKTFSSRRYEIWTMRSVYHNTVNFAGVEEKAGEEYKATGMTRDGGITTMRLERAYGDDRITAYERKVDFSESGLSVEETIVSSLERTLTLMSIERPQVEGREIHLGTLGCVVLLSDVKDIETEEYVVDDDKLDKAWGKGSTLFRTLVKFDGNLEWRIY